MESLKKEEDILFKIMDNVMNFYSLWNHRNVLYTQYFTDSFKNEMQIIYDVKLDEIKLEINNMISDYENNKWLDNMIMEIIQNVKTYINDDETYIKQNTVKSSSVFHQLYFKEKNCCLNVMKCLLSIAKRITMDELKVNDIFFYANRFFFEKKITEHIIYLDGNHRIMKKNIKSVTILQNIESTYINANQDMLKQIHWYSLS